MSNLFKLDERMGPRLIKLVYVLGTIAIGLALLVGVAGGVIGCVTGLRSGSSAAVMAPLAATIAYAAGSLLAWIFWRIACELVLVVFEIGDCMRRSGT